MKILKLSLKVLLGLIALFAILSVLGYFALTRWINPNTFKPQIEQIVQQETGRSLTLTGDLRWKFFPNVGLHIGQAALSRKFNEILSVYFPAFRVESPKGPGKSTTERGAHGYRKPKNPRFKKTAN